MRGLCLLVAHTSGGFLLNIQNTNLVFLGTESRGWGAKGRNRMVAAVHLKYNILTSYKKYLRPTVRHVPLVTRTPVANLFLPFAPLFAPQFSNFAV